VTYGRFTSLEVCAGLGGQALGLERAGFDPVLLIDDDEKCCKTLKLNRRRWNVQQTDIRRFDPREMQNGGLRQLDLISGGLPRIKSSAQVARQSDDPEREILHTVVRLAAVVRPRALLLENLDALVNGDKFADDRASIQRQLVDVGYRVHWNVLDAADFGVPQYRRSGFLVALSNSVAATFQWPTGRPESSATVGEVLLDSMASRGWVGAKRWAQERANRPGPALIGGSNRRGGADLGPSGSKRAWLNVGIDGSSLSDDAPPPDFPEDGVPKINVRQAAMLQRVPDDWLIFGGKTAVYRQIGHAMPPSLGEAVGTAVATALAG
jgi:site-specific DNA-cytosine methylase